MNQRERNEKHCWIFPLVVMAAFAAKVTCGAQIWPCPGICFTGDVNFPRLEKGVVLLDMGIPQTERPSVYGLSFSFWRSHYEETMMGIQFGLVEAVAADASMTMLRFDFKLAFGIPIGFPLIGITVGQQILVGTAYNLGL